jgi:hypothetical protein
MVPIIFLEWTQTTHTITMMFKTFFKITIWLMPFLIFMEEHPAMHFGGSEQIDLISISRRLSPYVQKAYILDPNDSKGDHSTIGIDFDFGLLISNHDLSDIEPGHIQNCTLVLTNVKASKKFLELIKKKNLAHNLPHQMNALYDRCKCTGQCSDVDRRVYQMLCKETSMPMASKLKQNVNRWDDSPGHE